MNSQSHRRCWMLKASEIFGGAYDSNLHASLNLTSRCKDITRPHIKNLMMAQAVWGLCVHVPLQRFFNLFLNRHQELQTTYHDRIDGPQNKFCRKFLNRLQLFLTLHHVFTKCQSNEIQDSLLMMDEFYNFAFCYTPSETFSHDAIVALKDQLENMDLEPIKEQVII